MIEYLDEVYLGKEYIASLQNQLSIIRSKFMNRKWDPSFNTDKDMLKFNRLIENFFGFYTFSVNIVPQAELNAMVMPLNYNMTPEERERALRMLKSSRTGFRFDKSFGNISGVCTITFGIINFKEVTDEEIMGMLLHEIGHCFFDYIMNPEGTLINGTKNFMQSIRKVNKMILNRLASGKPISNDDIKRDMSFIKGFNIFKTIASKPIGIINRIKRKMSRGLSKLFKQEAYQDNLSNYMVDYTNEKFADMFATMYGYGAELHSCLMKLTLGEAKEFNDSPKNPIVILFKAYKLLAEDGMDFLFHTQDEHPDNLTRLKVSLDYMKREVAKQQLDPKLKAQAIEDVDQLSRMIDDFLNNSKKYSDISVYRKYYIILYKRYGGDMRETVADNDALFDMIDKRYNEVNSD